MLTTSRINKALETEIYVLKKFDTNMIAWLKILLHFCGSESLPSDALGKGFQQIAPGSEIWLTGNYVGASWIIICGCVPIEG